jgi:hypothetical protein
MTDYEPPVWRVLTACLVAPLVPVAVFAALAIGALSPVVDAIASLYVSASFVYPAIFVVGPALYFLMRRRVKLRLLTIAAIGGIIGAAPWILFALLSPDPISVDGGATSVNGGRPLEDWIAILRAAIPCFIFGAIGGAAFWFLAVFQWKRQPAPSP